MTALRADRGYRAEDVAPQIRLALFHGPDEAASAELAKQLAKRLVPDGDAALTLSPGLLKDDPGRLGDEAAAVSMFGNRLVIRIDGADESCVEAFGLLLDLPAVGNPVIAVAGDLKKTSKLLALVTASNAALAVQSYEPQARDAARWLAETALEYGLETARDAETRLLTATGGDRGLIRQELGKLALYLDAAPERPQRLTVAHLAEIGADIADDAFGPLVDAVAGGSPPEADRQLRRLTAAGVSGIPLLYAVARRLRTLLDLSSAVAGGMSPGAAVKAARPPIFWRDADAITAQLQRWRDGALRSALARLLAAERDIKSSGSAGEVLASQALLGIAVLASR